MKIVPNTLRLTTILRHLVFVNTHAGFVYSLASKHFCIFVNYLSSSTADIVYRLLVVSSLVLLLGLASKSHHFFDFHWIYSICIVL